MKRPIGAGSISLCLGFAAALGITASASAQNRGDEKPTPPPSVYRVANAAEFEKMQEYVAERHDKHAKKARKHLRDKSGREILCIDINDQPALSNPALAGHKVLQAPTSISPGLDTHKGNVTAALLSDPETGKEVAGCPAGTVPQVDITIDDVSRFETLNDFFAKVPSHLEPQRQSYEDPAHNGPTSLHQYAHAARSVTNWGAIARINAWKPYTELNSEFSLAQIWVHGGSGSGLQTLEVGVQKYHDLYNDDNLHLFIYSTRGNYAANTGCYNNTCNDFVQVSSTYYPAMWFSSLSTDGGTQYQVGVQWFKDMDGGAWWLNVEGNWVGYYPRNLYTAVANRASGIDYGGEVVDKRNLNLHTSTDMGSGKFPSAGWSHAAYFNNVKYNYATTTNPNTVWNTNATGLTPDRSDAACYDIGAVTTSSDPNWNTYFYFGGPGYHSVNCR